MWVSRAELRRVLAQNKALKAQGAQVQEGEILGLVGESGCGKSVTAQSIMRIVPTPPAKIVGGTIQMHIAPENGKPNRLAETGKTGDGHKAGRSVNAKPVLDADGRPAGIVFGSLHLLKTVKEIDPSIFTKSGIMVGLGETKEEVLQVMDDLRSADVDFMTIGQYLQPTPAHAPVARYVTPDEFSMMGRQAKAKGFLMVASSPLTRSSYHAGDDFAEMKKNREEQLARTV